MMATSSRRRGFTLAEALVAFALISACLTVVASIFSSGQRAMLFEETGLEAVRSARVCLETLRADIEQADPDTVTAPNLGDLKLTLERSDPVTAIRALPLPMLAAPGSTDPAQPPRPRMMTVRWRLDEAQHCLVRDAEPTGGPKITLRVGRRVVGFKVGYDKAPGAWVDLTLKVQGAQGLRGATRDLTFADTVRPRAFELKAP